ncbi:hypothetical protein GCM10010377_73810 [Streptomyces viridiviolaceus]|nr:hypothetical protein GCM10010377_73810 [Streptomyces viridiviolaceus]
MRVTAMWVFRNTVHASPVSRVKAEKVAVRGRPAAGTPRTARIPGSFRSVVPAVPAPRRENLCSSPRQPAASPPPY